jgi:KaiC/GvpD/RAD55 family RecA-like ATPase
MSDLIKFGIQVLDAVLPNGFPRSSFVLISGEGGTGKSVILQEAAYQRLKKGDKVLYICLDDSPDSILDNMRSLGFDVEGDVEERIIFVDGFSYRAKNHLKGRRFPIIDPNDLNSLTKKLNMYIDNFNMANKGLVIFDSLTEIMTLCGAPMLLDHIKTWRAIGPKEHGVTFLASHHYGIRPLEEFSSILDYIMDGLIDIRYDPVLMEKGILLKQLRVRKMRGVWHDTRWRSFVITSEGVKEFNKVKFEKQLLKEFIQAVDTQERV